MTLLRSNPFKANTLKITPLRPNEVSAARELLLKAEAVNTLPGARFEQLSRRRQAGVEFAAVKFEKELRGLLWHGVSVALLGMSQTEISWLSSRAPEFYSSLANYVVKQNRLYASVLGEPQTVQELWQVLSGRINPAREFRLSQPLMAAVGIPKIPAHPRLRQAEASELELVFPAAVAMFREEVGIDPLANGRDSSYYERVKHLISQGACYVIREGDTIIFKADVGAIFASTAQIQGVWVHPDYRGQKIASSAMAALVSAVQKQHAPQVTLYVNDFNQPARAAYHAAGFREIGELATIMLA